MKKLHKALMGVTALVMAFSVSAMAACSNTDNDPNSPNNPNSPNYVQPVKNSEVKKVMEAFGKQSFKAVGLEGTITRTENSVYYYCDASGTKLEDAEERETRTQSVSTTSEKLNIKTLESDEINHGTTKALDKDGKVIEDSKEDYYSYLFQRGGKEYNLYGDTEITDFSNVKYDYVDDVDIPPQVAAVLASLPEEGVSAELMTPVVALMRLGDIYGGATYANKKLTVNFNKVAYKLYTEVIGVIDSLNDETKVGDLIAATPVKNLLQSLTYGIDAKEIYDQVVAMVGGENASAEAKAQIDKLPKPAEKETVYSYLLKLLQSKDVAELIFSMAAPGLPASAIAPVADFKVSEIITLVMGMTGGNGGSVATQADAAAPTMAQIKTMVKGMINKYVSITEDKVTVKAAYITTEISALQVVFNVGDDYTVSSISVSADVAETFDEISERASWSDGNGNVQHYYGRTTGTRNTTVSFDCELSKTEYTLKTINTTTAE